MIYKHRNGSAITNSDRHPTYGDWAQVLRTPHRATPSSTAYGCRDEIGGLRPFPVSGSALWPVRTFSSCSTPSRLLQTALTVRRSMQPQVNVRSRGEYHSHAYINQNQSAPLIVAPPARIRASCYFLAATRVTRDHVMAIHRDDHNSYC